MSAKHFKCVYILTKSSREFSSLVPEFISLPLSNFHLLEGSKIYIWIVFGNFLSIVVPCKHFLEFFEIVFALRMISENNKKCHPFYILLGNFYLFFYFVQIYDRLGVYQKNI
jgi:hypothetical protein